MAIHSPRAIALGSDCSQTLPYRVNLTSLYLAGMLSMSFFVLISMLVVESFYNCQGTSKKPPDPFFKLSFLSHQLLAKD